MGGCRCTFRGCPNSSDGVTHFFHYPVRDSDRCKQWISNANRPEFICLTTAQLKNKVVCEHHFLGKMFMSPASDRLVHDAIPTEEGPPRHGEAKAAIGLQIPQTASQIFAKSKKPIDEANKNGLDLETSDVSSTTLLVSESPILGLAFYSKDTEKKSSRMTPYTEALTRRSTGLSELFKRKILEKHSKQARNEHVKTVKQLRRVSARNVLKAINSDTVINKIISPAILENKAKIGKKNIEKNSDSQLSQKQTKVLDKDPEYKSSQIQPASVLKNVDNSDIPSKEVSLDVVPAREINSLQNKFSPLKMSQKQIIDVLTVDTRAIAPNNVILPSDDVLVIPLESDIQLMEGSQRNLTHFEKTAGMSKTILFGSDGTVSTTTQDISSLGNKKNITVLQTVPITFVPKAVASPNETDSEKQYNIVDQVMQMIEKNSRDIGDLKNLMAQNVQQNNIQRSGSKSGKRKIVSSKSAYVKKLKLYCDIVQYLSPSVAKLVHKDMFPSGKR